WAGSYVLLTRPPLEPKLSCDLHALGTPPTFILSQDQTLHNSRACSSPPRSSRRFDGTGIDLLDLLVSFGHHESPVSQAETRHTWSAADPDVTGILVQILPAIQMLMCAAAPRATNRNTTHPRDVRQANS